MTAQDFVHYPMGPALRGFLGLPGVDHASETIPRPAPDVERQFMEFLEVHFGAVKIADRDVLIDLIEELTAMGMSQLAILVRELNPEPMISDEFRALLALGSATMMEGEFDEAEQLLLKAHFAAPEESAPYLNLAEIYYATERDDDALNWVIAGLKITPNRARLWELFASIHLYKDKAQAVTQVREMATKLESYAGLSLAADMLDSQDPLLKAQMLEALYDQGARDDEFLIEYTAVLGLARQYEKVPAIVWQAEKIAGKKVPWQLYAHTAQAHLAMQQETRADEILQRLERRGDCPSNVIADLRNTYEQQLTTS